MHPAGSVPSVGRDHDLVTQPRAPLLRDERVDLTRRVELDEGDVADHQRRHALRLVHGGAHLRFRRVQRQSIGVLPLGDLLGAVRSQQQTQGRTRIGGRGSPRRVDQRNGVAQRRLAPASLGLHQFRDVCPVRHVADQADRGEPQQVSLIAQAPDGPPRQQGRRRFGREPVATDRDRVPRLAGRDMMVDHDASGSPGEPPPVASPDPRGSILRARGRRCEPPGPRSQGVSPFPTTSGIECPSRACQRANQDRGSRQAVRVEVADHRDRSTAIEAVECVRQRRRLPQRDGRIHARACLA